MRIVGGDWRGRSLEPLGRGASTDHLRPTSDRVRESLFNVIAHGGFGIDLAGARVLDLFAGTGALGLEALSRGAARAVFVDSGRAAGKLIAANLAQLDTGDRGSLIARDASRLGRCPEDPFNLIFLDPPYGKALGHTALRTAYADGWIAGGALVIWEENAPQAAPDGFILRDTRRYGETHITFLGSRE